MKTDQDYALTSDDLSRVMVVEKKRYTISKSVDLTARGLSE